MIYALLALSLGLNILFLISSMSVPEVSLIEPSAHTNDILSNLRVHLDKTGNKIPQQDPPSQTNSKSVNLGSSYSMEQLKKWTKSLGFHDTKNTFQAIESCRLTGDCFSLSYPIVARLGGLSESERRKKLIDYNQARAEICFDFSQANEFPFSLEATMCSMEVEVAFDTAQLELMKKSCDNGLAAACTTVGRQLNEADDAQAIRYFQMGCDLDDGESCHNLAKNSTGERKVELFEKSCSHDQIPACHDFAKVAENLSQDAVSVLLQDCSRNFKSCEILEEKDYITNFEMQAMTRSACLNFDIEACDRILNEQPELQSGVCESLLDKISEREIASQMEAGSQEFCFSWGCLKKDSYLAIQETCGKTQP